MWILCFAHCKQKEEQREKWSTTSHHIPTVEFCSAKKLVTLFFSVFFFLEYPDITFQASNFAQQKLATRFFFPWKLVGRYPSEIICFVGTGASAILYFCPITNRRQRHNSHTCLAAQPKPAQQGAKQKQSPTPDFLPLRSLPTDPPPPSPPAHQRWRRRRTCSPAPSSPR